MNIDGVCCWGWEGRLHDNVDVPLLFICKYSKIYRHGQNILDFFEIHFHRFLNCQKATAAAAATLRESTWCDIGMRTT